MMFKYMHYHLEGIVAYEHIDHPSVLEYDNHFKLNNQHNWED